MPQNRPWTMQKKALEATLPDRDTVRNMILKIEEPRDRMILAILYLTGARAGEVTGLTHQNIGRETIKGKECIKFTLRNKKNRKQKTKILAWPINKEPEICGAIFNHVDNIYEGSILTPTTVQRIHQIVKKYTGWNTHYLRHICLSYRVVHDGFNEIQLMYWAGWTDPRPSQTYVHYRYGDFIE